MSISIIACFIIAALPYVEMTKETCKKAIEQEKGVKMDEISEFEEKLHMDRSKLEPCELAAIICYDEPYSMDDPRVPNGKYLVTKDNQEIYRYNGSYYEPNGEQFIRARVQDMIGLTCTPEIKNKVISCVKDDFHLWIDREQFNNNTNVINLKNGVYNIETKEFNEHNPSHFFTYEISVEYVPETDCQKIKALLSQILTPEDIPIIQELFGYCLYPRYDIHKAFMFIGDGANGKSTLLNLLTMFLSKTNISSVPLQDITKDRFASCDLHGKLANICADIPNTALNDTDNFKKLTGQDSIRGQQKFKKPFDFTNNAKLIFSANQIPATPIDQSDAFFRRWILINFPNRFIGSNCDRNILKKITTPREMSGLLNWAVEGLQRLLEKGEFSMNLSIDDVREHWNKSSDMIAEFIQEHLEKDVTSTVTKEEVYNQYKQFAREKKYPTIASNVFSKKLKESITFEITEGQKHAGKKTWRGIRLKEWKKEGLLAFIEEQTVETI